MIPRIVAKMTGHEDSDEGQLESDREGVGHHVGDPDSGEGGAEVTVDQPQKVVPEPLEKRIVEVVDDSVLLEGVWRCRLAPAPDAPGQPRRTT